MKPPANATSPPVLTSRDIVAGLGAAPRELLAACLALFDDSTLQRRIGELMDRLSEKFSSRDSGPTDAEAAASVRGSLQTWRESRYSDNDLRLLLWIYLREAFALQPVTFASLRSAGTAADDMVARALHSLQPGMVTKGLQRLGLKDAKELPTTLDALARKTMEEMMVSFLDAGDAQSKTVREELLAETRARLADLPPEDRERLLQAVEADEINDAALRNILLTGGGFVAFSGSVSLAGFSAYILAAQASAFIPLVSGPALVSVVAVLSNPITVVAATAGMGWWATRSANEKIRGAVAVRVLSLLVLNGLDADTSGARAMVEAFTRLGDLRRPDGVAEKILNAYRVDWRRIEQVHRMATALDPAVASLLERPAYAGAATDRMRSLVEDAKTRERRDTMVLAGLTLGEILYNAFSLDPSVLEAADFSRVQDLGDPVAFAAFAHQIESMNPAAQLGAVSNLKGYVAERVVAARLMGQGHVVEFPEASNEPGWDILVDGEKFQVKDLSDLSGLQRHFDRGFDYPVIANAEIASILNGYDPEQLPEWAGQVFFVEGYSNEVVEHVTRSSLEAGDDMLHPNVPVFTLVLSGIRNVGRMNRNEITGAQAIQEVLLDGGTRAGLAVVGNYVGVGVGLLVFGPAGALVLGAVAPIVSQRQSGLLKGALDKWLKDKTYLEWVGEARDALNELVECARNALKRKADLLRARQPGDRGAAATHYLRWRIDDQLGFFREAGCRLEVIAEDKQSPIEIRIANTLGWLSTSTLHRVVYQNKLATLSDVVRRRPPVGGRIVGIATETTEQVVAAAERAKQAVEKFVKRFGSSKNKQL